MFDILQYMIELKELKTKCLDLVSLESMLDSLSQSFMHFKGFYFLMLWFFP